MKVYLVFELPTSVAEVPVRCDANDGEQGDQVDDNRDPGVGPPGVAVPLQMRQRVVIPVQNFKGGF